MNEFLNVLALASMPALGNFAGGLLAEFMKVSNRRLSLALHAAAGILFAVVGIELMPEALSTEMPWIIVLAFVLGGAAFTWLDQAVDYVANRFEGGEKAAGPFSIFFAVSVDLFSDGLMIGAGSAIDMKLAFLLALGQVTADVPEGFATIATFKNRGFPKRKRFLMSAAFVIPVFLGASVGYWAVQGGPELLKLSLLAFTAGILLTAAVEEVISEAHEESEPRWASLALVGGFALFALTSAYFG